MESMLSESVSKKVEPFKTKCLLSRYISKHFQTMDKTGVIRTRIYQIGHADLFYASKPLEIRVFDNVEMQLIWDADEAIDGVVEDFLFV